MFVTKGMEFRIIFMIGISMLTLIGGSAAEIGSFPGNLPRPSPKVEFTTVIPKLSLPEPAGRPLPRLGIQRVVIFDRGVLPDERLAINGLLDLFGSAAAFTTVRFAEKIELRPLIDGAHVEGPEMPLSLSDAAMLRATVASDASYDWDEYYYWSPGYHFRLKFQARGRSVIVDLNLRARVLRVLDEGREIAAANYAFGFPVIAAVIERYFPGATE